MKPTGLECAPEMAELRLLPRQYVRLDQPAFSRSAAGSAMLHVALAIVIWTSPLAGPARRSAPAVAAGLRSSTPLIAPPPILTQRGPGTGRVSPEVNLEGLLARPAVRVPALPPGTTRPAAPRPFELAAPARPQADPKSIVPPPPQFGAATAVAELPSRGLPAFPASATPLSLPQIQAEEKPKIAFETPGTRRGTPTGASTAAVPMPQGSSVEEAARAVARGGLSGGIVVGDIGVGLGGLGEALNKPASPGRNASALELLSDPQGADFRPYLIRILSTVRRNWFAVIPESARMGRRGRVQIQFAINRDGSVPKLVIAVPSGADALDRAAVAGISASNPFPPLPDEFRGQQVRLQFTFLYNLPSR